MIIFRIRKHLQNHEHLFNCRTFSEVVNILWIHYFFFKLPENILKPTFFNSQTYFLLAKFSAFVNISKSQKLFFNPQTFSEVVNIVWIYLFFKLTFLEVPIYYLNLRTFFKNRKLFYIYEGLWNSWTFVKVWTIFLILEHFLMSNTVCTHDVF